MNKIVTHLDLELSSSTKYNMIQVQAFDHNTRVLEINLYHQGKPYDLSGVSWIDLVGHRGDGAAIYKGPLEYDENNNIYVTLTNDIICAKGICELKLELYSETLGETDSRELLSSFPFSIRVAENIYDENKVMESPQYNKLQDKIDEVTLLEAEVAEHMETTLAAVQENTSNLSDHISDSDIHMTSQERTLWNTVSDKVEKEDGKGLSSNDYTSAEKNKLAGIAENANYYIHPDSGSTSGSYGDSSPQTPSAGQAFKVPSLSVNEQGHITSISEHTVTLPTTSVVTDSALSSTSVNPVQNKVISAELNKKADSDHDHDVLPSGVNIDGHACFHNTQAQIGHKAINDVAGIYMKAGDYGFEIYECMNRIIPTATNMTIGSDLTRIAGIHFSSGMFTGSDKHIKRNIETLTDCEKKEKYKKMFDDIRFVRFIRKQEEIVGKQKYQTTDNCRYRLGIIAQELEDLLSEYGLDQNDFAGVASDFCYSYKNFDGYIGGGWNPRKEGYDYSENTYNWKHRNEPEIPSYEIFHETIEKNISDFKIEEYRKNIAYIMLEDNSKLTQNQPPVTIRSISLVNKNGETEQIPLSGNTILYYEEDDPDFTSPLSSTLYDSETDSLTVNFNKMYGAAFLQIPVTDITEYEKICIDVDYISEYKIYLLPQPETDKGYQNANVWDRARNDQILYNYSFNYDQLFALSAFILQESRREFQEYKAETESKLEALNSAVNRLSEQLQN